MAIRDLIPWGRQNDQTPVERRDESGGGNPLLSLHRDVNRLFDDVFRGFSLPAFGGGGNRAVGWPSLGLNESDSEIRIRAELPGMEEKDVEILVEDGVLTLRGEKKSDTEDKERGYSEHYYGRFERQVALPRGVEQDKAKANFKNGVLTITVPKSKEAIESTRRIPINAS